VAVARGGTSLPDETAPAALLESSRAIRTIRGEAARCAIDRFSFLGHATFARLIDWVCSGGTGKPAVAYESRAELCPSGFFYFEASATNGV
jgi:hypothetical protein